jgi:hypothetical protein
MTEDEMTYVEGGAIHTNVGTAKSLKNTAAVLAGAWAALAVGCIAGAAATAASGAGVGISVILAIGGTYCTFAANKYRLAYNYYSTKSQTSSKKYYITAITLLGIITGVNYGAV